MSDGLREALIDMAIALDGLVDQAEEQALPPKLVQSIRDAQELCDELWMDLPEEEHGE